MVHPRGSTASLAIKQSIDMGSRNTKVDSLDKQSKTGGFCLTSNKIAVDLEEIKASQNRLSMAQSQSSTNVTKQQSQNQSTQQKYTQYQSNKNLIKVNLLDKPRNSNIGIKGPHPSTQIKNLKFVPLNVLSTPILQSLSPRSDHQMQTVSAPTYLQRKNSQEKSPPKFQNSTKAYQTQQRQVENYLKTFNSPEHVRYSSKIQNSKNIKMQTQLKTTSKYNVADERYSFSPIVYKSKQIKHQTDMERGTIQSKKPNQDSLILSEYNVYQTTQASFPKQKIMTSFQQDLPNVCQTIPVTTETSNFIKICQEDLQICDVVDEPTSKENDKTQDHSSNAYQASNWNSVQQFYNNGLIQKSVNTDGIACINFSLRSVSNMSFTNQEDANRRVSRNSNVQDYEANSKSRLNDQHRSTSLNNMQKRSSQLFQPSKTDQGVAERLKQKQYIKTKVNTLNQGSLDNSYKKLQISKKQQPVQSTRKNSISTANNSSKIIDFKQRSDRYSMLIQTNNSSPSQQPYSSKTSTAQSKKLIDQHKPKEIKPIYGVLNERGKHLISNASKNFNSNFGKMQNSEPKHQKGEQIKVEIRQNYMSSISSQNNLLSTKTISGVDPDHNNNTMLYSGTYNTSSHHTSICKDNSDQNNMDSQLLIDMSGVSSKLKVFVERYSSEFALLKREVVSLRERNQFLESQLMLQSNSVTTAGSTSNTIPKYQKVQESIARRKC
ncbi:UNKNOWN [Stylonychia lemnae]|uniref:Uncharacterized protein n=1 Tax=Stylonychia lemnae TaxID=5949 RepID=A0A078A1B4_STYLE|nr:UNKNOWN [Stylonychia lemnae]|eukprot:CDW75880.1 UNKNOWN [Stylonychia lemnae]